MSDLSPGLSKSQIDELTKTLLPYKLPQDLYELYQWRNGQKGYCHYFPLLFLPLDTAIEQYHFSSRELEGWNPLWFPFCNSDNDQYLVELSAPQSLSSPIYLALHQDPDMCLWYNSVRGLVDTTRKCLQSGACSLEENSYLEIDREKYDRIRLSLNPGAFSFGESEVRGANVFDTVGTRDWPDRWKNAAGIEEQVQLTGDIMSLSDFLAEVKFGRAVGALVAGRIVALEGGIHWALYTLSDGKAEITVFCKHKKSIREIGISDDVELELTAERVYVQEAERFAEFTASKINVLEHSDERRLPVHEDAERFKKAAMKLMQGSKGKYQIWTNPHPDGTAFQSSCIVGTCKTEKEALESCQKWVEGDLRYLLADIWDDETARRLLDVYTGELLMSYPRIKGPTHGIRFSAIDYAKSRAEEICAEYQK